jgi:hypothetical protein
MWVLLLQIPNSFNLVCDSEEDTIIELVAAAVVIDFHVQ